MLIEEEFFRYSTLYLCVFGGEPYLPPALVSQDNPVFLSS